jgi:hypothetical protein
MFVNLCTTCEKRQLVLPSQIRSVVDTERGVRVTYTCWCGDVQAWDPAKGAQTPPDRTAVAA